MENAAAKAHIQLEQIDPRALIAVATDIVRFEYGLTTGEHLRQCWESNHIQRVSPDFNRPPPNASQVRCPDGKIIFIKFTSDKFQLLEDVQTTQAGKVKGNMAAEHKHNPPPKKGAKPVKAAASKNVAKPIKPSKNGNDSPGLSTDSNRSTLRAGLKPLNNLDAVWDFMIRAGTPEDKLWEQLVKIMDAEAKGKGKWMLNRVKSQLV